MKKIFKVIFYIFFLIWAVNECENESEFKKRRDFEKSQKVETSPTTEINSYKIVLPIKTPTGSEDFYNQNYDEETEILSDDEESNEYEEVQIGSECIRVGAFCNDGTYSSATGSGACSHHGGVGGWDCQ